MVSINISPGISAGWSEISYDLYRAFLFTYGASALARMAVEAYKQIAVVETAWYDVPAASFAALETGFIQHVLLSFAVAEVSNMVIGALIKRKARIEGIEQGIAEGKEQGIALGEERGLAQGEERGIARGKAEMNAQWRAWLQRKSDAEANGATFTEPPPDAR